MEHIRTYAIDVRETVQAVRGNPAQLLKLIVGSAHLPNLLRCALGAITEEIFGLESIEEVQVRHPTPLRTSGLHPPLPPIRPFRPLRCLRSPLSCTASSYAFATSGCAAPALR